MKAGLQFPAIGVELALVVAACSSSLGGDDATGAGGTGGAGGRDGSSGCDAGQMLCGPTCVSLTSDPSNCGGCGILCSSEQRCQDSQCVCEADFFLCNGACIQSDPNNCGSCSHVCAPYQVCANGVCVIECSVGQMLCGTTCDDLLSDNSNCGGCGHACGSNQHCQNAICVDDPAP